MHESSLLKAMFFGVLAEEALYPFPSLEPRESDALGLTLDAIRGILKDEDPHAWAEAGAISGEVHRGLAAQGVFGLRVPAPLSGGGLSQFATCRVLEELARTDLSLSLLVGAHLTLGVGALLLFGSTPQKEALLPRLAQGDTFCAFALAEAEAGSDASNMKTRGEPDGGGHFRLFGTKAYVLLGGQAEHFVVFARTSPRYEGAKPRITAFLVQKDETVSTRPVHGRLGIQACPVAEVTFVGTRVSRTDVLGDVGRGHQVAMQILNHARLGLSAAALGATKRLVGLAVQRTTSRRAFARPIAEFALIKDKLARMLMETYAVESMLYLTAGIADRAHADFSLESALCKIASSETLWRASNHLMQIAAGHGYLSPYPFSAALRDARFPLIYQGTNETLRCFVALGGMQGPGKAMEDVSKAMQEPIKGFGLLSDFAIRKAKEALSRPSSTLHHPELDAHAAVLVRALEDLSRATDKVLRRHGRTIAEMQYTQKRVAELAMDMLGVASVISRTTSVIHKRGVEGARREMALTELYVRAAERRMREIVVSFDHNEDELRKAVAANAVVDGGYPLDMV